AWRARDLEPGHVRARVEVRAEQAEARLTDEDARALDERVTEHATRHAHARDLAAVFLDHREVLVAPGLEDHVAAHRRHAERLLELGAEAGRAVREPDEH